MITTNKLKPLVLSALIASCLTVGWQNKSEAIQLTVDEFSNPGTANADCASFGFGQCTYSGALGSPQDYLNDQQTVGGVIGTTRELSITDLTGNTSTAIHGVLPLSSDPAGTYQFFDFGILTTFNATLLYNSGGGGLNTNASAYNNGQFIIDVVAGSYSGTPLFGVTTTVTLITGAGSASQNLTLNSDSDLIFNLNAFSPVDLSTLQSIQVNLSPDATWDGAFQINRIYLESLGGGSEIPEPTSILSIVGVGVLAFASRRQKKN